MESAHNAGSVFLEETACQHYIKLKSRHYYLRNELKEKKKCKAFCITSITEEKLSPFQHKRHAARKKCLQKLQCLLKIWRFALQDHSVIWLRKTELMRKKELSNYWQMEV